MEGDAVSSFSDQSSAAAPTSAAPSIRVTLGELRAGLTAAFSCIAAPRAPLSSGRPSRWDVSPTRAPHHSWDSRMEVSSCSIMTGFSGPLLTDEEIIGALPNPHQPPLSPASIGGWGFLDSDQESPESPSPFQEVLKTDEEIAREQADKAAFHRAEDELMATLPYEEPQIPLSSPMPPPSAVDETLQSILQAVANLSMTLTSHFTKLDTRMAVMQANISTLFDAVRKGEEAKKEAEAASAGRKRRREEEKEEEREKTRKKADKERTKSSQGKKKEK